MKTNYLFLFLACTLILFSFSCNTAPAAEQLTAPDIVGKTYDDAREIIIKEGWKPVSQDEKTALADGGVAKYGNGKVFWEKGYHEVEACSGTGEGLCSFAFSLNGKKLNVTTAGEEGNGEHAMVKETWIDTDLEDLEILLK